MLDILYDDGMMIAVDKPAGLSSIPEGVAGKECLLTQLEKQVQQRLFIVHRLDKEVSGLILFAKTAETHRYLNLLFSSRKIIKTYVALVLGIMEPQSGRIDKPIRQFGSGRMGTDPEKGKASVTDFEVISTIGGNTLIRAFPLTGRRHQIRVHLYSIGHPVAGDQKYGDRQTANKFPRLMLHSLEISLLSSLGEELHIRSKLNIEDWLLQSGM